MSRDIKMSFKERSDVAVKCLPEAPYRNQLEKLHSEMLNKITELEFFKENYKCLGCRGETHHCGCGLWDKELNHIQCHDCGQYLKKELWVPKDHSWKKHALCNSCISEYDPPEY